ncbi:hypothetical protein Baya_6343 [Bagarius yarrelli]|uniref:Uncharacterized protein n=1 Tax=Bagarius yarrelli TaxID=175774 RepID=A0A556TY12_BAGYA|nr:hypothetical protein Baya_6343 [Bagarius yarrelli]
MGTLGICAFPPRHPVNKNEGFRSHAFTPHLVPALGSLPPVDAVASSDEEPLFPLADGDGWLRGSRAKCSFLDKPGSPRLICCVLTAEIGVNNVTDLDALLWVIKKPSATAGGNNAMLQGQQCWNFQIKRESSSSEMKSSHLGETCCGKDARFGIAFTMERVTLGSWWCCERGVNWGRNKAGRAVGAVNITSLARSPSRKRGTRLPS